ncbi:MULTISPECIES: sigma-54 dependent transcriptional regulator [unclassified Iodidimonas]|jgi:DNA-binding NtrC family response regulator|uniref:sigma-54-dependent transcriptional regulator n=1 Tax=unclassified Iodidimonas TaxID=2626145 RepID=UPI0024827768|nr:MULTISPECIES: sigma-54 dependent transcriptional regulator [unclassified Iodidimonas]
MNETILIVDDEPTQRHLLTAMIARSGHHVENAGDGSEAVARIDDPEKPAIACVILDMQMPGMNGLDVLQAVRPRHPHLPVIILTAHSGVSRVVEAMKAGASDFIVKPASAERLRTAIDSALSHVSMTGELPHIKPSQKDFPGFENMVGESPPFLDAIRLGRKAAAVSIPVLIEGPSGVGKEIFARAIHQASNRKAKPFITVNCGAIPENLVESILFGHEKGAFTGASDRHIGKFQEASGGTLFLDEVGELPLDVQVKLLRVLQENEVDPIGAARPVPVDIRLISATNRHMAALVENGHVREDLFYRLNVFPLTIPALQDRAGDIPLLARHFVGQIARAENLEEKPLSADALTLLSHNSWPGNIRQLQNAVFLAMVMSDGPELTADDFPQLRPASPSAPKTAADKAPHNPPTDRHPEPSTPAFSINLLDHGGSLRPMADLEAEIIAAAIRLHDGKLSEIARRLGIGRSTLYRRLDELGLSKDPEKLSR